MRVLDLFSGYGGFSLAFERAGFETVAFSEIDPFACKVLAHRWPATPNLGDIREIDGSEVRKRFDHIDVVTFGTPCQDLSVAGKRAGLAGERSGLFHAAVRVIAGARPTFAVWENVPGAFSSSGGRDFAAVLDALAQCGALDISWRVLDAQYAGVPQRRRRIFLVADFAGERAGEILSFGQSLSGHLETSGEKGQVVTSSHSASTGEDGPVATLQGGGRRGYRVDAEGAAGGHLLAYQNTGQGWWNESETAGGLRRSAGAGAYENNLVAGTVSSKWAKGTGGPSGDEVQNLVTHPLTSEGHDASEDGTGRGTPLVPIGFHCTQDPVTVEDSTPCLGQGTSEGYGHRAVAFALRGREEGARVEVSGEGTSALRGAPGGSSKDYVALAENLREGDRGVSMAVRRLTPL